MNCVVLQNADGAHLGFMLYNPDLGQPSGDCLYYCARSGRVVCTTAAGLLFERRELGESSWRVSSREAMSVVVQTPGLSAELVI